ncbi:MAG: hypothetical protein E7052_04365 [Lentisphaerae bacterium]|nr:hypothetical protein [Lentisphaerota bacterium]
MSKKNIAQWYEILERDPLLRQKALAFQKIYPEQEQVIDAFIALASENGCDFTFQEFMEYMYDHAEEVK